MVSASQATTHYLQFDIQWSSIALIWYDYALTFPLEVKYVWGSKLRLSTFLYLFCRYALLGNVLYLLAIADKLNSSCDAWYKIIGALSVLGRAAVIVTFTGRTYAVWGQNRIILAYLAVLGLACVALDITHVPGLRCVGSSSIPIANDLLSILMVVFEFSSVFLTSFRSIKAFRVANSPWKAQKRGFMFMIFEQGILYFSIVSLFTTAAVILNFRAPSGFFQRLLNAITLPLSGLLTARFLLHIREWEYKHSGGASSTQGPTRNGVDQEVSTMHGFRAAPGVISTIIEEDFGSDPVVRANEGLESGLSGSSLVAGPSGSTSGSRSAAGNSIGNLKEA